MKKGELSSRPWFPVQMSRKSLTKSLQSRYTDCIYPSTDKSEVIRNVEIVIFNGRNWNFQNGA